MDLFVSTETATIFIQLTVAAVLGMILGIERNLAGKTAGMRTYALVSLGSALFVIISVLVAATYLSVVAVDQLRVTAGVISGIGFLGAGLIIVQDSKLSGLTTAASLWVAAGVGIAVGYELYGIAIFSTFLILFIFTLLWFVEQKIKNLSYAKGRNEVTINENKENQLN